MDLYTLFISNSFTGVVSRPLTNFYGWRLAISFGYQSIYAPPLIANICIF